MRMRMAKFIAINKCGAEWLILSLTYDNPLHGCDHFLCPFAPLLDRQRFHEITSRTCLIGSLGILL